jgi:hypothetical protein
MDRIEGERRKLLVMLSSLTVRSPTLCCCANLGTVGLAVSGIISGVQLQGEGNVLKITLRRYVMFGYNWR